jgi:hypothetical protein
VVAGYVVATTAHEAAHAFAVKSYGRRVNRGGFMLMMGMPFAFVDTSDMWFGSPYSRIVVALSGPLATTGIAGGAALTAATCRNRKSPGSGGGVRFSRPVPGAVQQWQAHASCNATPGRRIRVVARSIPLPVAPADDAQAHGPPRTHRSQAARPTMAPSGSTKSPLRTSGWAARMPSGQFLYGIGAMSNVHFR